MAENPFGSPAAVVGEVMPQATGAAGLVQQGQAIQQMRDSRGFATAISVQQPRNLKEVEKRVLAEAALLGESAYYSWLVKDKRTGKKKLVEGPTIDAAMVLLTNWGSCVIDSLPLQELGDAYILTAACVDLERGVTVVRPFKLAKGRGSTSAKYDDGRAGESEFGKAASKAARNAILQMIPTWLKDRLMTTAKDGVREKLTGFIERKGIAAAQDYAVAELGKYGVTPEAICEKQGRADVPGLTVEDLVDLRGDLAALQKGAERPESLFPPPEGEKSTIDALREELTTKPEPETDKAYNDAAYRRRTGEEPPEENPEAESGNSKLQAVMDRQNKEVKSAQAEPTETVEPAVRRRAIRVAWGGIPEGDRPQSLKNLTLKGKVKKITRIEEIELVDDEGDLLAIHESFVDANRAGV